MIGFNDMPYDVILIIFSFLNFQELLSSGCVCKLWFELSQRTTLYKRISLYFESGPKTDTALKLISRGNSAVTQLTLYDCSNAMTVLAHAVENCPNLRELILNSSDYMPDRTLKLLTDNCAKIEKLKFYDVDFRCIDLAQLLKLKQLRVFHLFGCAVDNRTDIMQLITKFPLLEDIKFCNNFVLEGEEEVGREYSLPDNTCSIVANRKNTLKKLIVSKKVTRDFLLNASSTCRELRSFGVRHYSVEWQTESEIGLQSIFNMNSLEKLQLWGFWTMPAASWSNLFRSSNIKNLRHLDLADAFKLDDEALGIVAEKFPLLLSLSILGCVQITPKGFEACLEKCTKLKFLFINNLFSITESCLSNIPNTLVDLILLDLGHRPDLSKSFVKNLENRMPQVTVNWVRKCGETRKNRVRYYETLHRFELDHHF